MMDNYDIWTFTDASRGINQYYQSPVNVYGFVHMSSDINSGNLFPWAGAFQATQGFDIDTLETCAIYLALLDIRDIHPSKSICIVTDSDFIFYRMKDAIAAYNGFERKRWMEQCNNRNALVFACADLYLNLKHWGYRIDTELCKSHVDMDHQRWYMERENGFSPTNRHVKNINIGNSYADYYMNNIATTGNLPYLNQFNSDSLLHSLHSGYTQHTTFH